MGHAYTHAHIANPWRQTKKKKTPISSEEENKEKDKKKMSD